MEKLIKLLRRCYNSGDLNKGQVICLISDLQSLSKEIFIKHILVYCNEYGLSIDIATKIIIEITNITYNDMRQLSWYNWGSFIDIFISNDKCYTIKWKTIKGVII